MPGISVASMVALVCATGCSVGTQSDPMYPQPIQPAATAGTWSGPPGGAIDPGYGYAQPGAGGDSYEGSYPPSGDDPSGSMQPSADPADPNYALGEVTDPEIEATLDGYGEWIEDPVYGYVWLPSTTVVGEDFTPYDSSGEWMYTDAGWSFASDFDWGWLPFHYGQWTLYDDLSWGWVPDHTWASNWCEWRGGGDGGALGWRPESPTVRDHRPGSNPPWHPSGHGPANGFAGERAHNHGGHRDPDATWTFAAKNEFGMRNRPTHFAISDGLRTTTPVVRPPAGPVRVRAAELMGNRLRSSAWTSTHPRPVRPAVDGRAGSNGRPHSWGGAGGLGQSTAGGRPWMRPPSPWNSGRGGSISSTPPPSVYGGNRGYRAPAYNGSRDNPPPAVYGGNRGYQAPVYGGSRYNPPASSSGGYYGSGGYNPPSRPTWTPPADRAPSRGSFSGGSYGGGYRAPSAPFGGAGYRAPSSGSFSAGSSGGGYRAPSGGGGGGGYRAPSSSSGSSGGGRSYSSGSSSGSSGGSRSSGGGSSGSSGGGGRRR